MTLWNVLATVCSSCMTLWNVLRHAGSVVHVWPQYLQKKSVHVWTCGHNTLFTTKHRWWPDDLRSKMNNLKLLKKNLKKIKGSSQSLNVFVFSFFNPVGCYSTAKIMFTFKSFFFYWLTWLGGSVLAYPKSIFIVFQCCSLLIVVYSKNPHLRTWFLRTC